MDITKVIAIIKDFEAIPHLAFTPHTKHFAFRKKCKAWIKDIQDKDTVSVSVHDELIDTCNDNFIVVPKILRRISTPTYDEKTAFWNLIDHYVSNDANAPVYEIIEAMNRFEAWNRSYK